MQLLSHLENKFDEILRGELLCSLSRLAALLCEHDVEIIEAERSGTRLRGSATAESELTQVVRRQPGMCERWPYVGKEVGETRVREG